ncbi:MAG: hypothetical protein E7A11_02150 [Clostridium sp.]|uniref:hypothetical protein n=1 Tax=Clostridium TaxID=1485 RepID=UPI000D9F1D42|nr:MULTISPECIES: hypothetical protein [Clostridium]MDU1096000.1 hypothetical protein [Clostridioides difficile]MDU1075790.1 hypothetical protein [Clostridium sp.]MDU1124068.1 hypothetical protein [Clostridium sp.]MDU3674808.1 hypothetical protein [Clostridium sp.]MDU6874489.1 hypothetical protein [Clostridium sp.]
MDGLILEKLQVMIEASTKPFRDEIKKAQDYVKETTKVVNAEVNKIKGLFKSLGRFVITLGIGKALMSSIKSAMRVESAIQQITRTMGESTNQFLKWSKANALAFNMSQSDAMNYGAIFSNLVSTFSSGTKETLQYTIDLLKASSIIASGTGRTMEDVMERIRSGLLGNTEAIEDLGVNVNVAMLQSTEAFKRFANGKSWDQLSFQTQQQIRLMAILEQTSNKFGGEVFNNTNSSLQQFVAVLKDVALNIGNAFLPIMNVVMPILTNFAMGLRTVTGYVAAFMQTLFGYKPSNKTGVGGATGQVNNLGNAATKTGEKAKKAQKEVNRLLGGFDEINVLSKNSNSDSGGSGTNTPTTGGGVLDFSNAEILEPDTSGLESAVAKFKTIFAPVVESFENLKESLKPFIDNIVENLKWFWDEILVPFGTWTISEIIPEFFNILAGVLDILNPIIDVFQELGAWLWDSFLQPIASWTGGIIVTVLGEIADVLSNIGDWMKEHKGVIEAITIVVGSFALAWGLVNGAMKIWNIGVGLWNSIGLIATGVTIGFTSAMKFLTGPIGLVIAAIGAVIAIVALLIKNWDKIKEVASNVWNSIQETWNKVATWFDVNVVQPVSNFFSDMWEGIKKSASDAWDWILGLFSKGGKVFSGIVGAIGDVFKKIVNSIIGGINKVIAIPFNKINGLLNKIRDVEVLGFTPFDGFWGYNPLPVPRIPMLAKGGIVDSATLAVIGERGKEAVMPLENNTGWISLLADKLASRMPQGGNTSYPNGPLSIRLEISGTELGRVVIDNMNKLFRQEGKILLNL